MAALTTVLVGLGPQATLIYGAQGSSAGLIQVINLDTAITVYTGNASNIQIGQPGVFPLTPGSSMSFSGSAGLYGVTAAGTTAEVGIVPGGGNYSNGTLSISGPVTAEISGPVDAVITGTTNVDVQNASIDVLGVGGYITPGQVGNVFNSVATVIAPGTITTIANFLSMGTYASVVLSASGLSGASVAAGAAVCAILQIQWLDSASNVVAVDTLSVLLSPGQWGATWEIPVKGAAMALSVANTGTVGSIDIGAGEIYVDGAFRVVPNTRALQCQGATAPTLNGCVVVLQHQPVYSVIGWVASIAYSWTAANANVVIPLPQWVGAAAGYYQVITTALARNVTIVDLTYAVQGSVVSGSGYAFGVILNIPGSIDANPVPFTLNLPPTQCAVIIDTPATAGEFFLTLIGVSN